MKEDHRKNGDSAQPIDFTSVPHPINVIPDRIVETVQGPQLSLPRRRYQRMNTPMDTLDRACMQAALHEASAAAAAGEIPVGAVIMMGGETVATGQNRSIRDVDPSAHAEIVALRAACRVQDNYRLSDATLYVTLEPCPMCIGALVQARVSRLVFGAYDPKAGSAGSAIDLTDSRAFNHRFEVTGGVLAQECGALLQDFFRARR